MPYKQLRGNVSRLDLELTVRKEQTRELVSGRLAFLRRQEPWKLIAGGAVAGALVGRVDPARPISRLLSLSLGIWRLLPLASHWLASPTVNGAGYDRH